MAFFSGGRGFLASGAGGGGGVDLTAGGTIGGNLTVSGDLVFTGQARGPDGTAGAPAYSFTTTPDAGLRRSGGNTISLVAAAGDRMTVTTNLITATQPLQVSNRLSVSSEVVKVADYTAVGSDAIIVMNATALTLTLPASPGADQTLFVRNNDVGTMTIARNGQNINGAGSNLTVPAATGLLLNFQSGTGWWVVA